MAKNKEKQEEKKDNKVEDAIKNLSLGALVGGVSTVTSPPLNATHVSLNLKRETFFSLPSGKIKLNCTKYSCPIPDNLTADETARIRRALENGILVEGDRFIAPIDRNQDVLREYATEIKQYGLNLNSQKLPTTKKLQTLFRNGVDRNWTAKEIANFCIQEEKNGKNRKEIISVLENLKRYCDCPDTLFELPN